MTGASMEFVNAKRSGKRHWLSEMYPVHDISYNGRSRICASGDFGKVHGSGDEQLIDQVEQMDSDGHVGLSPPWAHIK